VEQEIKNAPLPAIVFCIASDIAMAKMLGEHNET
jgi:hypothetical protein